MSWALLYNAWAYDAERRGDWQLAEAVYAHGAAIGAAPSSRLSARRLQFRKRAYSQWLKMLRARETGKPETRELPHPTTAYRDSPFIISHWRRVRAARVTNAWHASTL